jgi:hypothetical protein
VHDLRLLLGALGLERWLSDARSQAAHGLCFVLIGLAFLMAFATVMIACLAAALYWVLLPELGPPGAAATTGAVLGLALAAGIAVMLRLLRPAQRQPVALPAASTPPSLPDLLAPQSLKGVASLALVGLILGVAGRGARRD